MAYQWVEKLAALDDHPAVKLIFLDPSICTYNTGVFLALCTSKTDIVAIEDAVPGDLGYMLLSSIITSFEKRPLTKADAVRVNIWLSWAGVIFLAIALMVANLKSTAIITVFIGSYFIKGEKILMDYYGGIFAVFCIALGVVIFFTLANNRNYYRYRTLFLLISLFSLMWVLLLREPIGQIGMASTLFVLIINLVKERAKWPRKVLKYGVMVLMIYSITLAPSALLSARDLIWHIPQGNGYKYPKHAISHSLLIGLGTPPAPNSWGITRSDKTGVEIMKNIDPDVIYASKKYYTILWKIYLQMFIAQPLEIINIYWHNIMITLGSATNIMNYRFYIGSLFVLIIVVPIRLKGQLKRVLNNDAGVRAGILFSIYAGSIISSLVCRCGRDWVCS